MYIHIPVEYCSELHKHNTWEVHYMCLTNVLVRIEFLAGKVVMMMCYISTRQCYRYSITDCIWSVWFCF